MGVKVFWKCFAKASALALGECIFPVLVDRGGIELVFFSIFLVNCHRELFLTFRDCNRVVYWCCL